MRHKLSLDSLEVVTFDTGDAANRIGTVHGHQEEPLEDGTVWSLCRTCGESCGGTCPPVHTCGASCPPLHTCGATCPPLHTCVEPAEPVVPAQPGVGAQGWALV